MRSVYQTEQPLPTKHMVPKSGSISLIPGRVPAFEEVEAEVKTAWLAEQKARAWQKAYLDMRAKYTVLLPVPAENASANGDTSRSKLNPALSGERGS
jgi:peptidyl-prolyl cis-trans isomerase C